MNTKILILAIVMAIVAFGGYFILLKKQEFAYWQSTSTIASSTINTELKTVTEKIYDKITVDLKNNGKKQTVSLVGIPVIDNSQDYQETNYFVRIYADATEKTIEWEGAPISSSLASGVIASIYNAATKKFTIEHVEGTGAHGEISQFIHWNNSKFEVISAIDENGKSFSEFFSDAGVASLDNNGVISVESREYDCPLNATISALYKWDGKVYRYFKTDESPCPSN